MALNYGSVRVSRPRKKTKRCYNAAYKLIYSQPVAQIVTQIRINSALRLPLRPRGTYATRTHPSSCHGYT